MSVPDRCGRLTLENWQTVRNVLFGGCDRGVSLRVAADVAGVEVKEIKAWIARSRKQLVEDEDWIHDIHREFDTAKSERGEVVRDYAWNAMMQGIPTTKFVKGEPVEVREVNVSLLMKFMEALLPEFKPKENHVKVKIDMSNLFQHFQGAARMRLAKEQEPEMRRIENAEFTEEERGLKKAARSGHVPVLVQGGKDGGD